MVSWSTIQSFVLFFGPILYPRVRNFYHRIQHPPNPPRPLTRTPRLLLNILFLTSLLSLLLSLPLFLPENIFTTTSSRLLLTPTDVLFTRLSQHRPPRHPTDDILRQRLSTRDGRLLYALHGPSTLAGCTWCTVDNPTTFLLYALPGIVFPHLLHTAILGLVTSTMFSGNAAGTVWRTQATLAGLALAAAEVWYVAAVGGHEHIGANVVARTQAHTVWTYWNAAKWRGVGVAAVDGLLGWAIYLTATGRWGGLLGGRDTGEKVEELATGLRRAAITVGNAAAMRQVVMRDAELRAKAAMFWDTEDFAGREVMQTEDVRAARRRVEAAIGWRDVTDEARKRATALARGLFVRRGTRTEVDDADAENTDAGGDRDAANSQKTETSSDAHGPASSMHDGSASGVGDSREDVSSMYDGSASGVGDSREDVDESLDCEGIQESSSS